MKIDGSARTQAPAGDITQTKRGDAPAQKAGSSSAQDRVQISGLSTQLQALETGIGEASGFDAAKVEAIKQAISEGRYTINPEAIADKLIASTRELLAQQQG